MSMSKIKAFANHELVTLAVYLLGGDSKPIDTEDVAIKTNELAPRRFTWRKYPDQINIDTVRKRLWDATKSEKGGLLLGSEKLGWQLTKQGLDFAKARLLDLDGAKLSRPALSFRERQWARRERERMISSDAYLRISAGEADRISTQEAEAFFRIDAYVSPDARRQKIMRTQNCLC